MGMLRKRPFLSFGGGFFLLAALGLLAPGWLGRTNEGQAGAEESSPKPSARKGCCCSNRGQPCCGETSECACRADQDKPQAQDKKEDKKEMMKASPEAMAKGKTARQALVSHQKALAKDGVFSCCIKPACTFCSTSADMCPCAEMLRKGGPVCPECWGGWQAGVGRLEGIDAAKVQVISKSKLKMMYDMKAMNLKKATEEK